MELVPSLLCSKFVTLTTRFGISVKAPLFTRSSSNGKLKISNIITLRGALYAVGGLLLWLSISIVTDSFCWFQSILGVPCPGCGSVRAAIALLQGQFAEAHTSHPLILMSLALCLYFGVRHILFRKVPISQTEKIILLGMFVLYIGVFAVRMVFLFPHTEPLVPLETALWRLVLGLIVSSDFFLSLTN